MRTEASAKFEKGLDPLNTLPAVNRACELVELLGAGEVVDGVIDILNYVPQPRTITHGPGAGERPAGHRHPRRGAVQYLARVDICTEKQDCPDGPADVVIPSWRGDVEGIADLAEEVARFYGYNNIPVTLMRGQTTLGGYSAEQKLERRLGQLCRCLRLRRDHHLLLHLPHLLRQDPLGPGRPPPEVLQDPEPPGGGHLHHAHHRAPLHAGDPDPELQLPQPGRAALRGGPDRTCPAARTAWPIETKVLSLGAYGGDMDFYALKGAHRGHAQGASGRRT